MADWWCKQYDTEPSIAQQLVDVSDNPVNLQGATVRFVMRPMVDGGTAIYGNAVIDQVGDASGNDAPTKGKVHYDWKAHDLDEPGGYYAEWQVTFSGGPVETFPNNEYVKVAVMADLGNVVGS